MKNLLIFILAGVVLLAGCSSKPKFYIYNWSYYIPEEVIQAFEKANNVQIVYDVFSSNEEMYAKLKAGAKGYDLIFPSGDYVSIMTKENMLEKLDKSKIPNLKNLDKSILAKITYDKGNEYSVPYMMGAAGIAVNKKYVKKYPKNFHIYEMDGLKGRMTMLDDMREVIGYALISLGYSVNTKDIKQLEKAKELVLKWKKNIQKFDAESFGKGFASGEFWVVNGYGENIFLEMDEDMKKDVDFFIPDTGGTMYIDNMAVLKSAKNKEMAFKFINFVHEPEIFAKIVDFLSLPSINVPARTFIKSEPIYQPQALLKCELMEDLGKDLELYNKIWQEIRLESK